LGRLERGFDKLHWPPVLLSGLHEPGHQCFECVWIKTTSQLNEYFTDLCGQDWKKQTWALYWIGQHVQTQYDDRKEAKREMDKRVTPHGNDGPRRDIHKIRELGKIYFEQNNSISSYRLAKVLKDEHDILVTQKTMWSILKKLRQRTENN